VAFWGYSSFFIVDRPELMPSLQEFSYGADSLGPFWQQPGTSILTNRYRDMTFPTDPSDWDASAAIRIFYTGSHYPIEHGDTYMSLSELEEANDVASWGGGGVREVKTDVLMGGRMTWDGMRAFFKTWSAVHSYQERHPEDKDREDGDIVDRFVQTLKERLPEGEEGVQVEWPIFSMMIRKARSDI